MTDLETAIRDALRERGESVPIRNTTLVARRRRWVAPLLAAALVIALVAITLVVVGRKNTTTPPAAPTSSSSFVGYSWRLVQIDDRQGRLTLPASTKAAVSFPRGGRMTGDDTVHALEVRYRIVPTGYQPAGPVTTSGNGLAGAISSTLKRTLFAIGSCFSTAQLDSKPPKTTPITATVHGQQLTLHTTAGVLTFVRNGTVVRIGG
jgi:hypothetical protein